MEEENNIQENIKQFSNEKLCEIIVSSRYLGVLREEAILSMTELASRREQGSGFPYEVRIEEIFSSLPKINLDLNTLIKNSSKLGKII
jgi:hypothetical protein